ncbi:NB-ARC and TPR domain protein [Seiridium cupressi]
MRLLQRDDAGKYSLTPDLASDKVPPYAILSHTWGLDEVIFADLARPPGDWQQKEGFEKIEFCADQARRDNLQHFWVDTCCIDKSDSVELQAAINSMFRWYRDAEKCYVYLPDVSSTPESSPSLGPRRWEEAFRNSRWFTRGWTLQELIAPKTVIFFSKEGVRLGDKRSLEPMIRDITGIHASALRGASLSNFTVSERQAWVRRRQTTREEDMAYSLLGIFGVFMLPNYGEGRDNAERRLREEVEKAVKGTGASDFSVTFSLSEAPEIQYFTARESELAEMRISLNSDGSRRVVVLHGLGGIGKTQLAVAYAKRYRDEYSAIFWFNIKDGASIQQGFTKVARQILQQHPNASGLSALDLQQDHEKVVEAVKAWLSLPGNTRWLAIYDNYDNPKLGDQTNETGIDIDRFIPAAYQGSIAITTRLSQVDIGHSIRIKKLESTEDSLQILSRTSGRESLQDGKAPADNQALLTMTIDVDAKKLAEKLDGLPLALATAGAYLRRVAIGWGDYLRLYEISWARLHESIPSLGSYQDRTLCSTWQLSYEQVQERYPLAAHLLRWWACFDNEDLWYELIQHHEVDDQEGHSTIVTKPSTPRRFRTRFRDALRRVKITRSHREIPHGRATNGPKPPEWVEKLADELKFNDAMGTLHDYGFVEMHVPAAEVMESRGYSIHSCLHSWTVHTLNGKQDEYLRKLAVKCVASRVPTQDQDQFWLLQRRLLSHAMMTFAMVQDGDEDLDWAFYNLGLLYADQGKMREAEEIYLRALRGYEKAWGLEHTSTLDTVNNLGNLYKNQGKMREAEEMYLRALIGYEKAVDPQIITRYRPAINTLWGLGALLRGQGKPAEARKYYQRAYENLAELLGPSHRDVQSLQDALSDLDKMI